MSSELEMETCQNIRKWTSGMIRLSPLQFDEYLETQKLCLVGRIRRKECRQILVIVDGEKKKSSDLDVDL